jgi:hypothetical protein
MTASLWSPPRYSAPEAYPIFPCSLCTTVSPAFGWTAVGLVVAVAQSWSLFTLVVTWLAPSLAAATPAFEDARRQRDITDRRTTLVDAVRARISPRKSAPQTTGTWTVHKMPPCSQEKSKTTSCASAQSLDASPNGCTDVCVPTTTTTCWTLRRRSRRNGCLREALDHPHRTLHGSGITTRQR